MPEDKKGAADHRRGGKPQAHVKRLRQTAKERERKRKIRELKRQHRLSDPIE
jgi:hypothetical protein